jgi:hypothetical protein
MIIDTYIDHARESPLAVEEISYGSLFFKNRTIIRTSSPNIKTRLASIHGRRVMRATGISPSEWEQYAAIMTGGRCFWCGRQLYTTSDDRIMFTDHTISIDHVMPIAAYGPTTIGNIMLTCYHCNSIKSNASPFAMIRQHDSTLIDGDAGRDFLIDFMQPFHDLLPGLYDFVMRPDSIAYPANIIAPMVLNNHRPLASLPYHFVYEELDQ